ncbi:MAG TPA: hypothetical protein VL172_13510 [Kofleriaceae bacterium]|nr:hypothetical protein [Kofleriaceae bacterium]
MTGRVTIALIALLAAARPVAASPLEMFGAGGRSPALAGTGGASAEDFDALYLNPAGLAGVAGKRLHAGLLYGTFQLDNVDRPAADAWGVSIGIVLRLRLGGALRDRLSFGIGLLSPPTVVTRLRAPAAGTPYYALLENRAQTIGVLTGVGVQLSRRWRAGVSLLALGALEGTLHIIGDPAGRVAATTDLVTVVDVAPITGVSWQLRPALALAAVFRMPSQSSYHIEVDDDLGGKIPIELPDILLAGEPHYDPMAVSVEADWRVTPRLRALAQLAWQRWSGLPVPSRDPIDDGVPDAAPGFHDTVVPRAAVEAVLAGGLIGRAGAAFLMTPAPRDSELIDSHRVLVGAGLGLVRVHPLPLRIDLWAQLHQLIARDHPLADGSSVRSRGRILVGGLSVGMDFE